MDGLFDEPRVGRPRKITDEQVEQVVVRRLEEKPKGRTHWSTRQMAERAGINHSTVGPGLAGAQFETHDYIRHGTLDLFAALNVATGEVFAQTKQRHRAKDLVAFLRDLDKEVETGAVSRSAHRE